MPWSVDLSSFGSRWKNYDPKTRRGDPSTPVGATTLNAGEGVTKAAIVEVREAVDGAVSSVAGKLDTATAVAIYSRKDHLAANARDYGAIGDGTSRPLSTRYATLAAAKVDFPAAIALTDELDWAAIASCVAARGGVYLPDTQGEYVINRPIVLASGQWIEGDPRRPVIRQAANNTQILRVTGGACVRHLSLDYTRQQTAAETSSSVIEMTNVSQGSIFEHLSIRRGARGIYNVPPGYTFSTAFSDLDISGFAISGFDVANNGGITGNVLSNVYVHNNYNGSPTTSTHAPVIIGGWDDGVIQQLNIEWSIAPRAMTINQAWNLTINGMHIEALSPTGDYNGVIELVGSFADRVSISGLSIISLNPLKANVPTNQVAVFKVTDGVSLSVKGLSIRGTVGDVTNKALVYAAINTGQQAWVELSHVIPDGFTETVGNPTRLPVVRQYNGDYRYLVESGKIVLFGTTPPSGYTWATGDRVVRTNPAAGTNEGWVCIAGGTPGTWVPFGLVEPGVIRLTPGTVTSHGSTATVGTLGAVMPAVLLDSASNEYAGVSLRVPSSWAAFDIAVEYANAGSGTGDVVLRPLYSFAGLGDNAGGSTTGTPLTATVGGQYILQESTLAASVANVPNKTLTIRIDRRAADAADTLPNDLGVTAIVLRRTS